MSVENINDAINNYKFEKAGKIIIDEKDKFPKWDLDEKWTKNGCNFEKTGIVYLWVLFKEDKIFDVAYVGKAGKTLKDRASQHRQGFKGNSKKGLSNGEKIQQYLKIPNSKIEIYARESKKREFNDEIISIVSADEESFIQKFRVRIKCELWNK